MSKRNVRIKPRRLEVTVLGHHVREDIEDNGNKNEEYAKFLVLTTVLLKIQVCWNITPCPVINSNRPFEGTYSLHLQDQTDRQLYLLDYLNLRIAALHVLDT
jgi:hypothetical protein